MRGRVRPGGGGSAVQSGPERFAQVNGPGEHHLTRFGGGVLIAESGRSSASSGASLHGAGSAHRSVGAASGTMAGINRLEVGPVQQREPERKASLAELGLRGQPLAHHTRGTAENDCISTTPLSRRTPFRFTRYNRRNLRPPVEELQDTTIITIIVFSGNNNPSAEQGPTRWPGFAG